LGKPAPLKKPAAATVLSLKVTLRNTKPPIWCRILMPAGMTLADLHLAIQTAMGWYNCHLHEFDIDGGRYGDPSHKDDWDDEAVADESRRRRIGLVFDDDLGPGGGAGLGTRVALDDTMA
jgi:hypothetical protein